MKKIISIFLCSSMLSLNFAFAQVFSDSLAEQLDKDLKVQKVKYQPIEDKFVLETLNPNLKVVKVKQVEIKDDFADKTLDQNLKVQIAKQAQIVDNLAKEIDKSKISTEVKKIVVNNFADGKIKVSPLNYHTTRQNLSEGDIIDFVLVEDIKIENVFYKKGTTIKARIETLSQNGAYGVPADLVVGNFTLPNKKVLNGQIERQGANRALWVYPVGYTLTCFFFIGLPIFAIRGGHVKLKPEKVYEIEI